MQTRKVKKIVTVLVALAMIVTAVPFAGSVTFAEGGEQSGATADRVITVDFTDAQTTCDFTVDENMAYSATFLFKGYFGGEAVEMTVTAVENSGEGDFTYDAQNGFYLCNVYGWVRYRCEYLPAGSEEPLVLEYKIYSLENHIFVFGETLEEEIVFNSGDTYMASFGYYTDESDSSRKWNDVSWGDITFEFVSEVGENNAVQELTGFFYALSEGTVTLTAEYTIPGNEQASVITFSFTVLRASEEPIYYENILSVDFKQCEEFTMQNGISVEPGDKVYFEFLYDTEALKNGDVSVSVIAGDATLEQDDNGTLYVQTNLSEASELVAIYTNPNSVSIRANIIVYAMPAINIYLDGETTVDADVLVGAQTKVYLWEPVEGGTYQSVDYSDENITFDGDNPDLVSVNSLGVLVWDSVEGTVKIVVSDVVTVTVNLSTHKYIGFGDVDESGFTDMWDLSQLFQYVSSRGTAVLDENIAKNGDINGDSKITLADVITLKLFLEGRYVPGK